MWIFYSHFYWFFTCVQKQILPPSILNDRLYWCYKCCIKIYISEGIDLTKSNNSKECMICHYTFFNHGFKFQDSVCNGWHDLAILSVNISDIVTIKNVEYRCIIHDIWSNLKQANLEHLKSSLLEESGFIYIKKIVLIFILLKTVFYYFFRLVYIYIYNMIDSVDIYKSLNINIGTVMKIRKW